MGLSDLIPSIGEPRAQEENGIVAVWRRDVTLTLTGELVGLAGDSESGVECASFRTTDGRLFAIIGDIERYRLGEALEVSGPVALWSTCQTFQVIRADRVAISPLS